MPGLFMKNLRLLPTRIPDRSFYGGIANVSLHPSGSRFDDILSFLFSGHAKAPLYISLSQFRNLLSFLFAHGRLRSSERTHGQH